MLSRYLRIDDLYEGDTDWYDGWYDGWYHCALCLDPSLPIGPR